jgi:hypothetical protein
MALIESDIILNSYHRKTDGTNSFVIELSVEIFRLFLGGIDYATKKPFELRFSFIAITKNKRKLSRYLILPPFLPTSYYKRPGFSLVKFGHIST